MRNAVPSLITPEPCLRCLGLPQSSRRSQVCSDFFYVTGLLSAPGWVFKEGNSRHKADVDWIFLRRPLWFC